MKDFATIILTAIIFVVGCIVGACTVYNKFPDTRTNPTIRYYDSPVYKMNLGRLS